MHAPVVDDETHDEQTTMSAGALCSDNGWGRISQRRRSQRLLMGRLGIELQQAGRNVVELQTGCNVCT